ncbi:MAG: GNAT family N-acetyltransferase [Candidatus Nanoarchaeia archaeon]|nr:GNAT family N-acetyltransferase [Candidatus Nanoarchaeia archaeon]
MGQLTFKELDEANFEEYKNYLLHSEEIFPEKIRSSIEDYKDMLLDPNNIAILGFLDNNYVGNIIGATLIDEEFDEYGYDRNKKIIYLYNIVIEKEYQGRGFGYELTKEFVRVAKEQGFEILIGHFRQNSSVSLIKKFGAVIKSTHPNWEESGEDYFFCEVDLTKV